MNQESPHTQQPSPNAAPSPILFNQDDAPAAQPEAPGRYDWAVNGEDNAVSAPTATEPNPDATRAIPAISNPSETAVTPGVPAENQHGRARGRVTAAIAGLGLLVAGGLFARGSGHGDQGVPMPREPGITAAPAPTSPEIVPAIPETSTTIGPVTINPEAGRASTTVAVAPAPAKPEAVRPSTTEAPSAAPTTAAETKSAERQLTAADIAALESTGFEGLKGHNLEVTKRFNSATGHNVLISVDGARLSEENIKRLETQIADAEKLAASRPSFTTNMKLGRETERAITFNVAPAPEKTHYFVFSKGDITRLAEPVNVKDFPNEYTQVVKRQGITATVVKVQPEGANFKGLASQDFYNGVGVSQAFMRASISKESVNMLDNELPKGLDTSYVSNPNVSEKNYEQVKKIITTIGQELGSNGAAHMDAFARAGKPPHTGLNRYTYSQAQQATRAVQFEGPYANMEIFLPGDVMSSDQFAAIQQAA